MGTHFGSDFRGRNFFAPHNEFSGAIHVKLKIRTKLGLGFGIVLLLMIVSAALTFVELTNIDHSVGLMTETRVPTMETARLLQADLSATDAKARQAILAGGDRAKKAAAQEGFDKGWDDIQKRIDVFTKLSAHWTLPANRDRLALVKELASKIRPMQQSIMDASSGRDAAIAAGNNYTDKVTPVLDGATKTLGQMADSFDELIQQTNKAISDSYRSTVWVLGVTLTLAFMVGTVLALFLSGRISNATKSVLSLATDVANGDLTLEDLKMPSQDELGDLTVAMNKMKNN